MSRTKFFLSLVLSFWISSLNYVHCTELDEIKKLSYYYEESIKKSVDVSKLDSYFRIEPIQDKKNIQFVGLKNYVLVKKSSFLHRAGLDDYDEILYVEYKGKKFDSKDDILKFIDVENSIVHYRKFDSKKIESIQVNKQTTDLENGSIFCDESSICTMKIKAFNEDLLHNADFDKLKNAKKIVFDLRDSKGGKTRVLLDFCDKLFKKDTILFKESYKDSSAVWRTEDKLIFDLEKYSLTHSIEILKNANTISASEIFIGILKHTLDSQNLTLTGEKTYGKLRIIDSKHTEESIVYYTRSLVYFDEVTYDGVGL